jgi:hypothetical protein
MQDSFGNRHDFVSLSIFSTRNVLMLNLVFMLNLTLPTQMIFMGYAEVSDLLVMLATKANSIFHNYTVHRGVLIPLAAQVL